MQLSGGLHAHIELARGPTPDEWCVAMQQSTSVAQGMQCLLDEHPKEYFERGKHIKGMLELKHAPAPLPPKYSMAQFNADADAVKADLRSITASSKSIIFIAYFAAGFSVGPWEAFWATQVQREVPAKYQGRVFSIDYMGSLGLMPLGMALAGPLVNLFGERPLLIGVAIFHLIICAVVLLVPGVKEMKSSRPPYSSIGEQSQA